ncbi:response regulator [Fervidobacterium thailandense]|uniref:Response regulator n=1 Tax=Fervidobacterium thailandense TaxID=1008305 RepID=A0A1E3G2B6_9BACT|nr:response regulator [Fervidobacterium thailandense]ODN30389.1 hypothetical protein A4H02_05955 [Fervidobacterium thailandense]
MKKVLVVDDSDVWRTYLKNLLELNGCSVEVARDGLDGLNKFFSFLPDVVIVDHVMPKLNGIHFARFIRSFNVFKRVGILMLTGADETVNPFWAKKSGVNVFVKKTAPQEDIEKAILSFISQPYAIEWTREIYKIHIEPYGELVDILDESLKKATLTDEILSYASYIFDEFTVFRKIYELFLELLEFEAVYFAVASLSRMRIYGFGKSELAAPEEVRRALEMSSDLSIYSSVEEHFQGSRKLSESFVLEEIFSSNDELLGFVLFENPKIVEATQKTLLYVNDALGNLFLLMNDYYNLNKGLECDTITGAYNMTFFRTKLASSIDFAIRNALPISVVKTKIVNLREFVNRCGGNLANEFLKKVGEILQETSQELVGRIKVDEFCNILIGAKYERAQQIAEDIKNKIKSIMEKDDRLCWVKLEFHIIEWNGEPLGEMIEKIYSKGDAQL